jgi:hypothetical protein
MGCFERVAIVDGGENQEMIDFLKPARIPDFPLYTIHLEGNNASWPALFADNPG